MGTGTSDINMKYPLLDHSRLDLSDSIDPNLVKSVVDMKRSPIPKPPEVKDTCYDLISSCF